MCSVALRPPHGSLPTDMQHLLLPSSHEHHPYTRWVCSGNRALVWSLRLGKALCMRKRELYPDNPPHVYEANFDALLQWLAPVAASLPYALQNDEMPRVSVSPRSVPDAAIRSLITGEHDRARGFRLYYWHTKRPKPRLWRFGGRAETLARRRAKNAHVAFVPDMWNEFNTALCNFTTTGSDLIMCDALPCHFCKSTGVNMLQHHTPGSAMICCWACDRDSLDSPATRRRRRRRRH